MLTFVGSILSLPRHRLWTSFGQFVGWMGGLDDMGELFAIFGVCTALTHRRQLRIAVSRRFRCFPCRHRHRFPRNLQLARRSCLVCTQRLTSVFDLSKDEISTHIAQGLNWRVQRHLYTLPMLTRLRGPQLARFHVYLVSIVLSSLLDAF